jgi:hypothetical protein
MADQIPISELPPVTSGATTDEIPVVQDGVTSRATVAQEFAAAGGVSGPSSATDTALARFSGTTGKIIENSNVTLSDAGSMTFASGQNITLSGASYVAANSFNGTTVQFKGSNTANSIVLQTGQTSALTVTDGSAPNGYFVIDTDNQDMDVNVPLIGSVLVRAPVIEASTTMVIDGGLAGNLNNVTTSPYQMLDTDYIVDVNVSSAASITLPSPIIGGIYKIKDNSGAAATNNITISAGLKTIDGASTYVINTNYGCIEVVYNDTEWNVIAGYNTGSASTITTTGALTVDDDTNVTLTLGGSPSTALVNPASITAGWTGLLAIARGGTNVGSVTTSPTASAFAGWDSNKNFSGNNLIEGYTTTATAAGTTTLTVASTYMQFFTGTTTQTVVLPVTSTLVLGQRFLIVNNSTGVVTVESSGTNTIQTMAANTTLVVTCILTSGTSAASWYAQYSLENALTLPLSLANGGTNADLTAAAGGIPYSTASALALTSAGSSGQLFQSAGTSAPGWTTATYPASVSTSGNVMCNDGTNFINTRTLNIDSSSRVTNTNQPCFTAKLITSDQIISNATQTTIAFNTVSSGGAFDQASNYSTTNHNFTAPIAGRYFFLTNLLINLTASTTAFVININSSSTYTDYRIFENSYSSSTAQICVSGSGILELAANETVSVLGLFVGNTGSVGILHNYSWFSGYLIS